MSSKESLERFNKALERVYLPYTDDQLSEKRSNRKCLTTIARFNTQLWTCIHFAESVRDSIRDNDFVRALVYFKHLDIGSQYNPESIYTIAEKLKGFIIDNGEGGGPVSTSVIDFTQAFATYIQLQTEIHATSEIIDADRAARDIAHMLTSHDITCSDNEKFGNYVNKAFTKLLSALDSHYAKTATFLGQEAEKQRAEAKPKDDPKTEKIVKSLTDIKIAVTDAGEKNVKATEDAAGKVTTAIDKGTKKISRACRKMKGRKPKYPVDKMEAVWTIHENARNNQDVKNMHPKGMATRGNEYLYCKRELTALDIHSVNQYSDILDARIKRVSRKQDS